MSLNLHPNSKLTLKIIIYDFKTYTFARVEFLEDGIEVTLN